jgi:hypothetical protein
MATNLRFSRMGPDRELKKGLKRFWPIRSDAVELIATASELRESHLRRRGEEVKPAVATLAEAARGLRRRLAEAPAGERGPK